MPGRPTLLLAFAVRDIAEAARNVREAGGEAGGVTAEPYGLAAMCTDNQGARFTLYQPSEGVGGAAATPARGRPGDLSYVTMEVPDSEKPARFAGAFSVGASARVLCPGGGEPRD